MMDIWKFKLFACHCKQWDTPVSKPGVGATQKRGSGRDLEPLRSMSQTFVISVGSNYFALSYLPLF